jgi:serine/threonine-protein kinase
MRLEPNADRRFLRPPDPDRLAAILDDGVDALPVGTRLGPYEIVEPFATGGMGAVYRARRADDAFQKEVAVKVIRPDMVTTRLRARFHRERQTLARLEHPGITRLLDGGTSPAGGPYLVMELVRGVPITRHCDERGLDVPARLCLFRRICEAVQAAHRALVVHCDLKPANILVTADGSVKLLDFGIAALVSDRADRADSATATRTAWRAGTPEYASPEQIRGEPVTTATDVYALGVILYELLAGSRPHAPRDEERPGYESDRLVCETDPPPPSAVTTDRRRRRQLAGDLDTIALTALCRDPARRYPSVEQLADDVERWRRSRPVRARRDSAGYRLAKLVRRHRYRVAAGAAVAAVLVAAMVAVVLGLVDAQRGWSAAASGEVIAFYQDNLLRANPWRGGGKVTVLDLVERAERTLDAGPPSRPEVEAGVRVVIGRTYANLMMWPAAAPHLERALALYRTVEDVDDDALADCLGLLGRARSQIGAPGAVALQREGLELRRRRHGPEHALVAEATGLLGYASWTDRAHRGDWREAERHYLASLAMFDRLGLGGTDDAARITMSLGFLYAHHDDSADAERMYRRALARYAELEVTEDLYELTTLGLYSRLLEREGRIDEARALVRSQLALLPPDFEHERRRFLTRRLEDLRRSE